MLNVQEADVSIEMIGEESYWDDVVLPYRNSVSLEVVVRLHALASQLEDSRSGAWQYGMYHVLGAMFQREYREPNAVYLRRFLGLDLNGLDRWDSSRSNGAYDPLEPVITWLFGPGPKQSGQSGRRAMVGLAYRIYMVLSEFGVPPCWEGSWGGSSLGEYRDRYYHRAYPYAYVKQSAGSFAGTCRVLLRLDRALAVVDVAEALGLDLPVDQPMGLEVANV